MNQNLKNKIDAKDVNINVLLKDQKWPDKEHLDWRYGEFLKAS